MVADFQITRPEPGSECDCCGATEDVAAFIVTAAEADKAVNEGVLLGVLCAECLARGIQVATGFRAPGQLAAWKRMRGARQWTSEAGVPNPSGLPAPKVVQVGPDSWRVEKA